MIKIITTKIKAGIETNRELNYESQTASFVPVRGESCRPLDLYHAVSPRTDK